MENKLLGILLLYNVALPNINEHDYHKPTFVDKCQLKNDWLKQKYAFQVELNSYVKLKIFNLVAQTPKYVKLLRHKQVFMRKKK